MLLPQNARFSSNLLGYNNRRSYTVLSEHISNVFLSVEQYVCCWRRVSVELRSRVSGHHDEDTEYRVDVKDGTEIAGGADDIAPGRQCYLELWRRRGLQCVAHYGASCMTAYNKIMNKYP